jgi:hypothetical protein
MTRLGFYDGWEVQAGVFLEALRSRCVLGEGGSEIALTSASTPSTLAPTFHGHAVLAPTESKLFS